MRLAMGWAAVALVSVFGFAIMGYTGVTIYRQAPPIPTFQVNDENGATILFSDEDVISGQEVWQSIGGQQVGSIWGHGALQAPDWSADWLHREAVATRVIIGEHEQTRFIAEFRNNTYDIESNTVWITSARARAIAQLTEYYVALFTGVPVANDGSDLRSLRRLFALKHVTLHDDEQARKLAAFVFWSSWACATERHGEKITYTNNWPAERLVGNSASSDVILWSLLSVAMLVAGVGALTWVKAGANHPEVDLPLEDTLAKMTVTPSMRSLEKWTWAVAVLLGFQICLGVYMAHVSVDGPWGIPDIITQHITYTVARSWHTQSAIFAIAASLLAAGLFFAPIIGMRTEDPPWQLEGVNLLWVCLLVIVVGSFAGNVAAIQQSFRSLLMSQWFGTQGYEYVDLGRFWQYLLYFGLVLWLVLVLNAAWPALVRSTAGEQERGEWHLVVMILGAAVLISAGYTAGFMYTARTNLAVMEYWRFWIVHMWVEGMFEVFITVIVAYIFVKLGLLSPATAASTSLFTTFVFLFGGIPGMYHHNYYSGTPTMIVAVGACFSALEVVPLALMGFDASEYMAVIAKASKPGFGWLFKYKPIMDCFVYVAFWNLVGAGFLGFLINPPISLYYMQGGYLTLSHSHGALWGVYGVLAMGLCLVILRLSDLKVEWNTTVLDWGLRIMNLGMLLQIFVSLFPIGVYQLWTAVTYDYWYARSEHFHGDPAVQWLKLARAGGDSIFALGMLMTLQFIAELELQRSRGHRCPVAGRHGLLEG